MVLFCIHCQVVSSSEDEMKEHFASEYHKFNATTDVEKLWKYRVLAHCLSIATEGALTAVSRYENRLKVKMEDIEDSLEEVIAYSQNVLANPIDLVKENDCHKHFPFSDSSVSEQESRENVQNAESHTWVQYTSIGTVSFSSEDKCVCNKPYRWVQCTSHEDIDSSTEYREEKYSSGKCHKWVQAVSLCSFSEDSLPEKDCSCYKANRRSLHEDSCSSFSSEESMIILSRSNLLSSTPDGSSSSIKWNMTETHSLMEDDCPDELLHEEHASAINMEEEIPHQDKTYLEKCTIDNNDKKNEALEPSFQSNTESKFSTNGKSDINTSVYSQAPVTSKVCNKCNKQTIRCKCIKRKFKKAFGNIFRRLSFWHS